MTERILREVTRAIILDENGKVLLGKRGRGTAEGMWALVGGKPDNGETPVETVIREVKEELGLDFEPQPYLEEVDEQSDPINPWKVYIFTGKAHGSLNPNEEIVEVVYAGREDLDKLDIAFDHRTRLIEYFESVQR
jgi:8-oxo-dGTP pyrophosphatase MutT (NUDIX family)